MKRYVVYLTRYSGGKLPPWYIGSSTEEKVLKGYTGSVKSKKWKDIYYKELNDNKLLFKTRILSYHSTREEALKEELRLQQLHTVTKSKKYFNESYAAPNGFFGRDISAENNPFYGKTHTSESMAKREVTLNTITENGLTIKEQSITKMTKTRNSVEENGLTNAQNTAIKSAKTRTTKILDNGLTIAQNRTKDAVKTRADTILENGLNIDQNAAIKQSQTKLYKEWKETIGVESRRKAAVTLKNRPFIKCPHCEMQSNSIGNLKRWHFDNCKKYKGLIDAIV